MAALFERLAQTLRRTRESLIAPLLEQRGELPLGVAELERLELALIQADVGVRTAGRLCRLLRDLPALDVRDRLRAELARQLGVSAPLPETVSPPRVVALVGVNGSGKTTTAAKLADRARQAGAKVLLVAADTHRAAAALQLEVWGQRIGVPVLRGPDRGDPAAVAHDAVQLAVARGLDLVYLDTAGRMHTNANLMAELGKLRRAIGKVHPPAPQEVLLVIDGGTGRVGLDQAERFVQGAGVTGLVLTKLDGTARGGIAIEVVERFGLPIRYLGLGEGLEDLEPFSADDFARALIAPDARAERR